MIRQQTKDLYYIVCRWLTIPNYLVTLMRYRRPAYPEGHYLHLGCGHDYMPGMVNIDGNVFRKKDLWLDLRNGLPFSDASVFFVFCCHVLEHLYPDEAIRLLKEIRRVLTREGVARVSVPSMEHAIKIMEGHAESHFPRAFRDPISQALNYLFCDGQHKYGYAFATLEQFALYAGFASVYHYSGHCGVAPKQYGRVTVGNEPPGSLVVELRVGEKT